MGAHHHHHHHHHHGHASRNIGIAFALNFFFAIVEFIGGVLTGSVAIQSDAVHDLGDSVTLGFAYFMEKFAQKRSSPAFSYGFRRFSLLSALINALILVAGSVFVLSQAIPRLSNPETPKVPGMIALALLGITVNGIAAWRVRRGQSLNEKVISWHLIEDVLGWVAILIASLVMAVTEAPLLDPLLSIAFTIFILWNVLRSLRSTIKVFLQGVPEGVDLLAIREQLIGIPHVKDIHDLHVWTLDGESHVITLHAVVAVDASVMELTRVKERIRELIESAGKFHATIELEIENEVCSKTECVTWSIAVKQN